eukprot:357303-Chlamydomonas_euryale.AAC.2
MLDSAKSLGQVHVGFVGHGRGTTPVGRVAGCAFHQPSPGAIKSRIGWVTGRAEQGCAPGVLRVDGIPRARIEGGGGIGGVAGSKAVPSARQQPLPCHLT